MNIHSALRLFNDLFAVALLRPDFTIKARNDNMNALFRDTFGELDNKSALELIDPEFRNDAETAFQSVKDIDKDTISSGNLHVRILSSSEEDRWYRMMFGAGLLDGQREFILILIEDTQNVKEQIALQKAAEFIERRLEEENNRKSIELEKARQLQLSFLPAPCESHSTYQFATYMSPAFEVGGDYYDYVKISDDRILWVVGDATGHGLEAGMMLVAAKTLLSNIGSIDDVLQLLSFLNEKLCNLRLKKLFMALTVLDISDSRIRVGIAGMPPVFIFRAETGLVETITIKALPLGILRSFQYSVSELSLKENDTLVVVSDGFTEQFNPDREMFGHQRISDLLQRCGRKPLSEIVSFFRSTMTSWANGSLQDDDATLLVLRNVKKPSYDD